MVRHLGYYVMGGDRADGYGTWANYINIMRECRFQTIMYRIINSDFTDPGDVPQFTALLDYGDQDGVEIFLLFSPRLINDESLPKLDNFYNQVNGAAHPSFAGIMTSMEFAKMWGDPAKDRTSALLLKQWCDSKGLAFGFPTPTLDKFGSEPWVWASDNGFIGLHHHNYWNPQDDCASIRFIETDWKLRGWTKYVSVGLSVVEYNIPPENIQKAIDCFLYCPSGTHIFFVKNYSTEPLPQENRNFYASVYDLYPGEFQEPAPPPTGNLEIEVLGVTSETIVTVTVSGKQETRTGPGIVSFLNIPIGIKTCAVSAPRYVTQTFAVEVIADTTETYSITLTPTPPIQRWLPIILFMGLAYLVLKGK